MSTIRPYVDPIDALTKLRGLAEQRHRDPKVSLERALEVLSTAADAEVEATARQVIGLAHHELGHLTEAVASFRHAIAISRREGLQDSEALAQAHLSVSLIARGDSAGAGREIAAAVQRASSTSRGAVALRQGLVLQRTGQLSEALVAYQRAQRWLEESDDQPSLALIHLNRGVLYAYQGFHAAALESLTRAEEISRARDLSVLVAMATHNIGFYLSRLGKLPDALAAFSRAEEAYAALGNPDRLVAVLEADRCETFLLAGLTAEAGAAAARAVNALVAIGDLAHLMEGRLLLARALLAAGDFRSAAAEAVEAARGFGKTRPAWAALARYVAIQADFLESQERLSPPPGLLPRCRQIASQLDSQGWLVEAAHVRTFAGRLALALGRPDVARVELERAVAARSRGTSDLRAQAWHAAALLRLAEGNRAGAKRALTRGLTIVDEYRASLGATELRANSASFGVELARLGLRLALEGERPTDVFLWAERGRAGALQRPAVRPPKDDKVADALNELRQTQMELRSAALDFRHPGGDAVRASSIRRRVAELEHVVRGLTMEASDDRDRIGRVDVAALRAALDDHWLVEFISLEGGLHAVTVSRHRVRLHHLGRAPVDDEKRYLVSALRRLMLAPSPSQNRAAQTFESTAARLDQMLLGSLGLPPDAPVVLVPTGSLHGVPWGGLPSLARRPTTIAPSAALWLGTRSRRRPPPGAGRRGRGRAVALVAGPQLPGAEDEVHDLAELYPKATTLTGSAATAAAVIEAFEASDVVHLAAHGRFRSDSPMFSSVLLADGPATVFDLERLRQAPGTVILAACDAAVSAVRTGDELLGTAAALLGLGVSSVVAPVVPVPDGRTAPFMVSLHRRLRSGLAPAQALVEARIDQPHTVGAAFICIGCAEDASGASG